MNLNVLFTLIVTPEITVELTHDSYPHEVTVTHRKHTTVTPQLRCASVMVSVSWVVFTYPGWEVLLKSTISCV